MFSKKNIVVTIGNYGSVVALHDGREIKNKIFLDELNDKSKEELKNIFLSHKNANIYILIDTIDQSYKKKVYPLVRRGDLSRLIKRDMASDGDKESFKNYIVQNLKKPSTKGSQSNTRWEALFVSAANTEIISKWIEFLLEMPGRLVGIYMLPVESFSLLNLLKPNIKLQSRVKNKRNDLYCLIVQNKVSGIRQVVCSSAGIVFTRVVNYNFEQPDFAEKYEQDLYSTFEYLKRLFPDVAMSEMDIVNILPQEALDAIKKINSPELNFINYTPFEAAVKTGESRLLSQNSSSCDLLISRTFSKGKKLLKFSTPKIIAIEKFYLGLMTSRFASISLIIATLVALIYSFLAQGGFKSTIDAMQLQKNLATIEFSRVQKSALEDIKTNEDGATVEVEKISDFARVEEALGKTGTNIVDFYGSLKFLKNFNVKLERFNYSLTGFNHKAPNSVDTFKINFTGQIMNKSGDIEDLFSEFDGLVLKTKETFKDNQVTYSDLPKNIDFNQKYYSFPIDFTILK